MNNLFDYIKRVLGKNSQRHGQIPDIATLKREHGDFKTYVVYDGENYHVINADGNCIEICRSLREVKTDMKGTIILKAG